MLIIREKFIAKPGQASKLAKMFAEMAGKDEDVTVMTDLTGSFNTVVMETRAKDMKAFEERMSSYAKGSMADQQKMTGYHDMFYAGSRQIFQIVE